MANCEEDIIQEKGLFSVTALGRLGVDPPVRLKDFEVGLAGELAGVVVSSEGTAGSFSLVRIAAVLAI
jgi:hypothetical protein